MALVWRWLSALRPKALGFACVDVSAHRLATSVDVLQASGAQAKGYVCNVGNRGSVLTTMADIQRDWNAPVGVLVNNAVWARFQPLNEIDEGTVQRMFAVGLQSMIWTLQAVAPQMASRGGGKVINLCSTAALQTMPNAIVYAALKAGVMGLTRAAAVELSPKNIRVNCILPGMIGTPTSIGQFDDGVISERLAKMPLGRFGDPSEIAALAAFLASDESGYVQVSSMVADGGWTVSTN